MFERWNRAVWAASVVATTLVLAACGGGRSSDGDDPAPPLASCANGQLASGAADTTLGVAGFADRDYDLVLPPSHACGQPIGVLVVLHGGASNKAGIRKLTCPEGDLTSTRCLVRRALDAGLAVVLPNGTDTAGGTLVDPAGVRTWNAGGGQGAFICVSGSACTQNIDDVGYFRALVADVGARVGVDAGKVFVTGFSNGAAMAQRLGCEAADIVAAIAPVSGENQYALGGCTPARPIAVLEIHGTLDKCWPYAGGAGDCIQSGQYVSVDDTLAGWVTRNGCSGNAATTSLTPLPGVNDGTSVVQFVWSGCAAGGAVEHLRVVGNGHYWPSGYEYASGATVGGVMSRQLDAAQAVVVFVAAHGRT